MLGSTIRVRASTAATCMAVGNVSLDDWAAFTSSFGCTGRLLPSGWPVSWLARLAMTSFTFMLDWVPDPVCQTCSGNSPSSAPAMISSATWLIRSAFQPGSRPPRPFTRAHACFR